MHCLKIRAFSSLVHSNAEVQTFTVDHFHLNIFKVSFYLGFFFLVLLGEGNDEGVIPISHIS